MPAHLVSATALVPAPAATVYGIIADYRELHPQIVPRPPFESIVVEQGGTGAGTLLRVRMRVLGRAQEFRSRVTEPEPGRVLVETNDTGYVTTFTVEPRAQGSEAQVTIATEIPARAGLAGAVERWLVRRVLQTTYARELQQLAAVAARQAV